MWKRHTRMISNLYVQHHWLATQKNWRQSIYQKISWLHCIMKHCKQRWRHLCTAAHFSESSKIQVFSNDCEHRFTILEQSNLLLAGAREGIDLEWDAGTACAHWRHPQRVSGRAGTCWTHLQGLHHWFCCSRPKRARHFLGLLTHSVRHNNHAVTSMCTMPTRL